MRTKDNSVETHFHPTLTEFLFAADEVYRAWKSELTITSGSEVTTKHSPNSLHYATPSQAADIRIWETNSVPTANIQANKLQGLAIRHCIYKGLPKNWIEVILESDHIHIEYQPKRQDSLLK